MTTIRDELAGFTPLADKLRALGIDPDLPAEWATVDRCLTWLREWGTVPLTINVPPGGASTVWVGREHHTRKPYYGATLHAALVAACKAVQEAEGDEETWEDRTGHRR